jgi:tRNA-dihydrouridine synthase
MFPSLDLIYNSNITSFEYYQELKARLFSQNKWMLGRGLLSNPLLAWQIKNDCDALPAGAEKMLNDFVFRLIENVEKDSNDRGHALNRLKSQFVYLSSIYADPHKTAKFVRKSNSLDEVKNFLRLKCTVGI